MGSNNISDARQIEAMKNLPADGSMKLVVSRGDATVLGRMVSGGSPFVIKATGGWKLTPAGIAKLNEKKAA